MAFRDVGSEWGRWDLHFHTPSSFDYAGGAVTNECIVETLRNAGVVAVAITDHHLMDVPRIARLQELGGDSLTVFPGIELRSELGGKESVHLIGIFPEAGDVDFIWRKLQGPLAITPAEVAAKGDDYVYVKFEDASDLIHELGGIVSVHVGRKSNSLENIGNDHPYKRAFKADLAKSHIDLFEIGKLDDAKDYREIVFPKIGFERPLIICSDNHNIANYVVKSRCWIKADTAFKAFQQIISDPQERVFLGETPPSINRVRNNSTKYLKSISFKKIPDSKLDEDWFSGSLPLNSGLIAIIGNKGMGKTALAESIGLLGNTAQHRAFTFLHHAKFKQPKDNKANHFEASLEWWDGHPTTKRLSDTVSAEAVETVSYIPQHYLEIICNEIHTDNNNFDKELKAVIFSHVEEGKRLGAESLDRLIEYLTEQTHSRMDQIRSELRETNKQIVELGRMSSEETKQTLTGLFNEKMRELEAHDKAKPLKIEKPESDPATQAQMQVIADSLEKQRDSNDQLANDLKQTDAQNRSAQLRSAVAERVLGRLRNFQLLYNKFLAEAAADCTELGLSANNLVKIQVDAQTPTTIRDEARAAINSGEAQRASLEIALAGGRQKIDELTRQLDAPNVKHQTYLKELREWQDRRTLILGDEQHAGTINYLQTQISSLTNVPILLKNATDDRRTKVREIYRELQKLIATYRSLYSPVQAFIERHDLVSEKFGFAFEAAIKCVDLEGRLFQHISQSRKGTFVGAEDGHKRLAGLVETADLNTEDGAVSFVEILEESLTHDMREGKRPSVLISDQVKKGSNELDVLNTVFSLEWLVPRYLLKWSGKNLEQLSPGERGSLLLIFYLLIDRRDVPLIIDQPEENLDNQTVYELLVPCIKEARKRRQVVIVTHNPNLAVVCDADQVIYCSIDKVAKNKVSYLSGALENPAINQHTIDVLEGTRPAFNQRDSKYQE